MESHIKQVRYIPEHMDLSKLQEDKHSIELGKIIEQFEGVKTDPYIFLHDLYPANYLESDPHDKSKGYHGNPMATIITSMPAGKPDENGRYHRRQRGYTERITQDFGAILPERLESRHYVKDVYISECAYLGKVRNKRSITHMYGVAIDLDYQTPESLKTFLSPASEGFWYPMPTYIAISGSGVHLWFLFSEPLEMFHGYKMGQLYKRYADLCKEQIIRRIWNPYTVLGTDSNGNELGRTPQIQSIAQSYRMPGTPTKKRKLCTVYRMKKGRHYGDFDDIMSACNPAIPTTKEIDALSKALDVDQGYRTPSGHNLEYWKENNPEWYQRRIVDGKRAKKGHYALPASMYEWFIDQVKEKAAYGRRYWCMWSVAIMAKKCGVPRAKLETDLKNLMPVLTKIQEDAPMEDADFDDAMKQFSIQKTYYIRTETIEKKSGITFNHVKRNGNDMETHLKIARGTRKLKMDLGIKGMSGGGRPDKQKIVAEWCASHPNGKKSECIADTGLSKKTVYKWFKSDAV